MLRKALDRNPPRPEESDGYNKPEPFIGGRQTFGTINDRISSIVLAQRHPLAWLLVFGFGFTLLQVMVIAIVWLLWRGPGIWGINQPVGWGFAIINFVCGSESVTPGR